MTTIVPCCNIEQNQKVFCIIFANEGDSFGQKESRMASVLEMPEPDFWIEFPVFRGKKSVESADCSTLAKLAADSSIINVGK